MCSPFITMEQVQPPTDESKKMVNVMKIIMIIQILFAVTKLVLFFGVNEPGFAFTELLSAYFIYIGYYLLSYISLSLYAFFSLYHFTEASVIILTMIQNKSSIFTADTLRNTLVVFIFISIVFYLITVYFTFHAYKSFKIVAYESNPNSSQLSASERGDIALAGQPQRTSR